MAFAYDVSVVISSYNRADDLAGALDAVLAQQAGGVRFEVVVVDNNSTDHTARVVEERMQAGHANLTYVSEPRQGLPYARNAGVLRSRAPIIAFTDDDVRPAPDWVAQIKRAFDEHPDVDCIGGKVLPRWPSHVPRWLDRRQLAPLALQHKGELPVVVDAANAWPCLIGANFAFRRRAFERAGLFDPLFTRSQDREIQLRLWAAGGRGLYVPDPLIEVDVPRARLTKTYYRLWHTRAGRFHAHMRMLERIDRDGRLHDEVPSRVRLFGVPGFLYREACAEALRWLRLVACGRVEAAFYHENRFRYVTSYIRTRARLRFGRIARRMQPRQSTAAITLVGLVEVLA